VIYCVVGWTWVFLTTSVTTQWANLPKCVVQLPLGVSSTAANVHL